MKFTPFLASLLFSALVHVALAGQRIFYCDCLLTPDGSSVELDFSTQYDPRSQTDEVSIISADGDQCTSMDYRLYSTTTGIVDFGKSYLCKMGACDNRDLRGALTFTCPYPTTIVSSHINIEAVLLIVSFALCGLCCCIAVSVLIIRKCCGRKSTSTVVGLPHPGAIEAEPFLQNGNEVPPQVAPAWYPAPQSVSVMPAPPTFYPTQENSVEMEPVFLQTNRR